eukprot:3675467-Rhodomonas_salina.2
MLRHLSTDTHTSTSRTSLVCRKSAGHRIQWARTWATHIIGHFGGQRNVVREAAVPRGCLKGVYPTVCPRKQILETAVVPNLLRLELRYILQSLPKAFEVLYHSKFLDETYTGTDLSPRRATAQTNVLALWKNSDIDLYLKTC